MPVYYISAFSLLHFHFYFIIQKVILIFFRFSKNVPLMVDVDVLYFCKLCEVNCTFFWFLNGIHNMSILTNILYFCIFCVQEKSKRAFCNKLMNGGSLCGCMFLKCMMKNSWVHSNNFFCFNCRMDMDVNICKWVHFYS